MPMKIPAKFTSGLERAFCARGTKGAKTFIRQHVHELLPAKSGSGRGTGGKGSKRKNQAATTT